MSYYDGLEQEAQAVSRRYGWKLMKYTQNDNAYVIILKNNEPVNEITIHDDMFGFSNARVRVMYGDKVYDICCRLKHPKDAVKVLIQANVDKEVVEWLTNYLSINYSWLEWYYSNAETIAEIQLTEGLNTLPHKY